MLSCCFVLVVSALLCVVSAQKPLPVAAKLKTSPPPKIGSYYSNPADGGCATGETAVRLSFGGASCAPACDADEGCTNDPAGASSVHPFCVLAKGANGGASGQPKATHCALHCNPASVCPAGAHCQMPQEICVYKSPTSLPDDTSMTTMGMTRPPTDLERLWAHDDNGH